jgi:hypothetical protein
VAAPIEQEVNGVEGMIYMSSTSASDGSYSLTVTFEVGTDLDLAQILVQNRVSLAEPRLPEEVKREGINTKKKSTNIVLLVSLFSPDGRYDELFLSNYATLQLRDRLSRIDGIGEVSIFPSSDYSMRVWLDPQRLKSRGITTEEVLGAIREQNAQVAAGQIGQPPAPDSQSFQLSVNVLGRLTAVEQFEEIIVKTSADGRIVRLKDVARLELGGSSYNLDLPTARRQRATGGDGRARDHAGTRRPVPAGRRLYDSLRHDALRRRFDRRGLYHALAGGRSGLPRLVRLPAGLAGDAGPRRDNSGFLDRHPGRNGGLGVLAQLADPVRSGARHRRGRRRRHRHRRG